MGGKTSRRLHQQLSLLFMTVASAIVALELIAVLFFGRALMRASEQQLLRRGGIELAAALQPLLTRDASYPRLLRMVATLKLLGPGVEAYILDSEGIVVADFSGNVNNGAGVGERRIDTAPVREFIAMEGNRYWPLTAAHPSYPNRQVPFVSAPLQLALGKEGFLFLALESTRARLWQSDISDLGMVGTIVLGIGLTCGGAYLIGFLTLRRTAKRFGAISAAVGRFARGEFQSPAPEMGTDELGELGKHVNEMASALVERDNVRRELLASISHDLNTPVSVIRSYIDEMIDDEGSSDLVQLRGYAKVIERNAGSLSELLNELFELAKLESVARDVRLTEVDLPTLVSDIVVSFRKKGRDKGVDVRAEIADSFSLVRTDPSILERVLANLLNNAIRHTATGGVVGVRGVEDKDEIELRVGDSGEGIPADELSSLFERFQQGRHHSLHEKGLGGLGLAICRDFVTRLGGSITVASTVGQGTTFSIRLPRR